MSESAPPVGHQVEFESLLRERIAAGLADEVSPKSVAAIVEEEMLSPISEDGRPKRV
jgi:hypothetical protein